MLLLLNKINYDIQTVIEDLRRNLYIYCSIYFLFLLRAFFSWLICLSSYCINKTTYSKVENVSFFLIHIFCICISRRHRPLPLSSAAAIVHCRHWLYLVDCCVVLCFFFDFVCVYYFVIRCIWAPFVIVVIIIVSLCSSFSPFLG